MKTKVLLSVISLLLLSGCYSFKSTSSQHIVSTEKLRTPTKEGKVCSNENSYKFPMSLVFINVDLTVEKARQKAGITEVISVEEEQSGNLLSHKKCVIVRGN